MIWAEAVRFKKLKTGSFLSVIYSVFLALNIGLLNTEQASAETTIGGMDVRHLLAMNVSNNCPPPSEYCFDEMDEDDDDTQGSHRSVVVSDTGPTGEGWIAYPQGLGEDGNKYPIVIWTADVGVSPESDLYLLEYLASHGFVVYSAVSSLMKGEITLAIDWFFEQNDTPDSVFYTSLNTNRIAAAGHSLAAMDSSGTDPRLTTMIHLSGFLSKTGSSYDQNAIKHPGLLISGAEDTVLPDSKREFDYYYMHSPVFYSTLADTDHDEITRNAMPMMTAWLRWHLLDETHRRDDFIVPECTYCTGMYDSKYRNWEGARDWPKQPTASTGNSVIDFLLILEGMGFDEIGLFLGGIGF